MSSPGLLDCENVELYESKLKALKPQWDILEKMNLTNASKSYSFFDWFCFYKSEVAKTSMIYSVRKDCGFDIKTNVDNNSYVNEFYTNVAENANSQIKSWCNGKSDLATFLQKLEKLIEDQERNYIDAISGVGDTSFSEDYTSMYIGPEWFSYDSIKTKKILKTVLNTPIL